MFERYTEKARRTIFFARYEAAQFGSPCIETEHLLLGVLREDRDVSLRFLGGSKLEDGGRVVKEIRDQIEAQTTRREKVSTSVDLPLSHESKRVLSYAGEEAERLNHRHIDTEHLLLGLLREEKCFAADILNARGLRLSKVRKEIAKSTPAEGRPERGRVGGFGGHGVGGPRFMGQAGWVSALQDAGRAVFLARHSAAHRKSPCIETTDLLLSLLHEKEFTDRFPGHGDSIRERAKAEAPATCESVSAEEIPFSEDTKLAFTFAIEEAAQLGHRTGPMHLLLGLLRVEYCAAAGILRDCGLNAAEVRARLTPPPPPSDPEEGRSYV